MKLNIAKTVIFNPHLSILDKIVRNIFGGLVSRSFLEFRDHSHKLCCIWPILTNQIGRSTILSVFQNLSSFHVAPRRMKPSTRS